MCLDIYNPNGVCHLISFVGILSQLLRIAAILSLQEWAVYQLSVNSIILIIKAQRNSIGRLHRHE
jgi:hypothetical protein